MRVRDYDFIGFRTGTFPTCSMVNTNSLLFEGQQAGSVSAYRAYSAVIWSLYQSVTSRPAPSVREYIGSGEMVPANVSPTKTNELYPQGRHIPSYPASAETTVTSQPL